MSGEMVYAYRMNDYDYFDEFTKPTCQKNPLTRKKSLLIIVKSACDRVEVGLCLLCNITVVFLVFDH